MKIKHYNCMLLPTTYSLRLLLPLLMLLTIAATYATASEPQAEVNAVQEIASRPLKFGEKLGQNEILQTTAATLEQPQRGLGENRSNRRQGRLETARGRGPTGIEQSSRNPTNHRTVEVATTTPRRQTSPRNVNILTTSSAQDNQRRRSSSSRHPEPEYITLPTHAPTETSSHLSRRHNAGSPRQNQIVQQQYDIPAIQKIPESALHKTGPSQAQQTASAVNANRSRFPQTNVEPKRSHELSQPQRQQSLVTAVATTTKRPTTSSRTNSHRNSQHSTSSATSSSSSSSSSRNSNHNSSTHNSNYRNHNEVNKPLNNHQPHRSSLHSLPVTGPSAAGGTERIPKRTVTSTATGQVQTKNAAAAANHSSRSSTKPRKTSSSVSTTTTSTSKFLFRLPQKFHRY